MNTRSNIPQLEKLADAQKGLITAPQALSLGVSRNQLSRMAADGRLQNVRTGVYRFVRMPMPSHLELRAAWLAVFPQKTVADRLVEPFDAVASGWSAATVHGLDVPGIAGDLPAASRHAFAVSVRKQASVQDVIYHQRLIAAGDAEVIDGLPVATPARLVTDLLRDKTPIELVDAVLQQFDSLHLPLDFRRMKELLAPSAQRYGYSRGDGESFANDLMERNFAYPEIVKAASVEGAVGTPETFLAALQVLTDMSQQLNSLTRAQAELQRAARKKSRNMADPTSFGQAPSDEEAIRLAAFTGVDLDVLGAQLTDALSPVMAALADFSGSSESLLQTLSAFQETARKEVRTHPALQDEDELTAALRKRMASVLTDRMREQSPLDYLVGPTL